MQDYIKKYIDDFFTEEEKQLFLINNTYEYNSNKSWNYIENEYKQLTQSSGLQDFHIKIGKNASFFIEQIFEKCVDDNTFVVANMVHSTIAKEISKINNKYNITYNDISNFNISKIIKLYTQSGCNKIFIYLPAVIEQKLLLLDFCVQLKTYLTNNNINHKIMLDDVSTMFLIPKNYSCFDYILFTCHSIIPYFDSGLLFYKENSISFGYEDCNIADLYLKSLKMILSKKDKLLLFNILLRQFYANELNSHLFYVPEFTPPHMFFIILNKNREFSHNIIKKYTSQLEEVNIQYNDFCISIRCCHMLGNNNDEIINGLIQLKTILKNCIKLEDRMQI